MKLQCFRKYFGLKNHGLLASCKEYKVRGSVLENNLLPPASVSHLYHICIASASHPHHICITSVSLCCSHLISLVYSSLDLPQGSLKNLGRKFDIGIYICSELSIHGVHVVLLDYYLSIYFLTYLRMCMCVWCANKCTYNIVHALVCSCRDVLIFM